MCYFKFGTFKMALKTKSIIVLNKPAKFIQTKIIYMIYIIHIHLLNI